MNGKIRPQWNQEEFMYNKGAFITIQKRLSMNWLSVACRGIYRILLTDQFIDRIKHTHNKTSFAKTSSYAALAKDALSLCFICRLKLPLPFFARTTRVRKSGLVTNACSALCLISPRPDSCTMHGSGWGRDCVFLLMRISPTTFFFFRLETCND